MVDTIWYELFVITATAAGFLGFLVYLLLARVPSQESMFETMMAVADAKIKEFGLTSPGPGGRKSEGLWGFVESFLSTPMGQKLVEGFAQKQLGTFGV